MAIEKFIKTFPRKPFFVKTRQTNVETYLTAIPFCNTMMKRDRKSSGAEYIVKSVG